MTTDAEAGLTTAYNVLDLPERISQGTTLKVKYTYLSDGTKVSALDASGAGLVYRGPFTYRRSSGGTLTFESAPFDSGRLTEAGTRYHVTDHLGSVRAVINSNASTTTYPLTGFYSVDDFAPFGTKSASSASSYLSLASTGSTVSLRDGFTGQEDQGPDFGVSYSDFGARQYSPVLSRWLVPDPLGEKYYDVSPYSYCAGNPVNLVDFLGMQWYSYIDNNGNTQYVYSEGEMPNDIKEQYDNLNQEGYSFIANNKYYSLFGKVLDWTDLEGKVYEKIDRLIIKYATDREDMETGALNKVSMYIPGMPRGENRTLGKERPFIYEGNTFTTLPVGSLQPKQPWYITLFSNGENNYIGNVYWNINDPRKPDIDTSRSCIIAMPDIQSYNSSFTTKNYYYWLRASNPSNGVNAGFQTLQLLFSPADAKAFMQSYYKIFGK